MYGAKTFGLLNVVGVGYTDMSSQVMEKMGNSVVVKEDLQDFDVPYSYETAMEALSSLITRKKRGDKSFVGGTYGKLERMSEYLKVTLV
jgi:folylpolyglutamate synthase